jgi:hypothetical protein
MTPASKFNKESNRMDRKVANRFVHRIPSEIIGLSNSSIRMKIHGRVQLNDTTTLPFKFPEGIIHETSAENPVPFKILLAKRIMNFTLSGAALLILWPVLLVVAIAVKFISSLARFSISRSVQV